MRTPALLMLLLSACSPPNSDAAPAPSKTYIRSMSIPDSATSKIECDTGTWRGTIEIAPDVKVGYRSISTTTATTGNATKTTITVNGLECAIEETVLRVGTRTIGPLSGEVRIEIRSDGIFVNGTRKSDL